MQSSRPNPIIYERLTEVTDYVRREWRRLNGVGSDVPDFDEEDIAPQLCEWHRLGKKAECENSPRTQFGRE